jgi:hypothetical protein
MRSANLPHWSIFALDGLGVQLHPKAPTGIEPVEDLLGSLEPKIYLYAAHFMALARRDSAP